MFIRHAEKLVRPCGPGRSSSALVQQLLRAATCCLDKTPVCLTRMKKVWQNAWPERRRQGTRGQPYKVRVAGSSAHLSLPQGELCGGTSSAVLHRCLAVDRALWSPDVIFAMKQGDVRALSCRNAVSEHALSA
jgi:hypothetical protein